jgi:hypothetical protein
MNNKFKVSFNLVDVDNRGDDWIDSRIQIETIISNWCIENIGPGEFPHWQFSNGSMYFPGFLRFKEVDWVIVHSGIFIFRDEDRVAFKLRFQL